MYCTGAYCKCKDCESVSWLDFLPTRPNPFLDALKEALEQDEEKNMTRLEVLRNS